MLARPGRIVLDYSGVLKCRYILRSIVFCILVLLQNTVTSEEAHCTKSTLKDHLRKSFQVLKLGRARNINSCITLCCSSNNCDLAILRNTRCYGIKCSRHDLCRSIMNGLREKHHEISKRSTDNREDIPVEFSHHPRFHGFCRHRRIVPHHVFLEGGRAVSRFHKLATDVSSSRECNEYCCQRTDCSLAFIMRNKCYGVICPDDGVCESGKKKRVPLHLEIALLQRRGSFGEASRVMDSDILPKPSERKHRHQHHHDYQHHHHRHQDHNTQLPNKHHYHHHHHGQQEYPNDDDRNYRPEHDTELPEKHRHSHHHHHHQQKYPNDDEHDSKLPEKHRHGHHHGHHHRDSKTKYNMETNKDDQSKESDHKKGHLRNHRHDHRKVNIKPAKIVKETHHHHHGNIKITHDTGRNSEETEDDIQDNENRGGESGHHKNYHEKVNMKHNTHRVVLHEASHDSDEDAKEEKNNRHKAHHKHFKMNSDMEHSEDEDISRSNSKKRRRHHRHKEMDSFENPEDDRQHNDRLKKKHRKHDHHQTSGNRLEDEESHKEKKHDSPKHHHSYDQDEKSLHGEDIMESSDKDDDSEEKLDDHENEGPEHEQENDDQDEDMNTQEDDDKIHRHEESDETSQKTKKEKKVIQYEKKGSFSKPTDNEMNDEEDDEESSNEERHESKDRGKDMDDHYDEKMEENKDEDKEHHYDKEMKNKDSRKKQERSKIKHGKDSHDEDEDMDDDFENRKKMHHEIKENKPEEYTHNHHEEYHHRHNDHVEDNDDNTDEQMNESEEKHHEYHHKHNIHDKDEIQNKNKNEKQAMNNKHDNDEAENMDEHGHHRKETNKKHQEGDKNEHLESLEGNDSDNENIMSQNNEERQDLSDKSHEHNPRHHTEMTHQEIHNEDKTDVKDDDEDDGTGRNFKPSTKKAKGYDSSKGEHYKSSKKQTGDTFKKEKNTSREREKMQEKSDENSEDKGEKEDERSEPKGKIHHEPDEDDENHENNNNEKGNKNEKNKVKDSLNKKDKDKTSEHNYDDIKDEESNHDSKEDESDSIRDDESDSREDENKSVEKHEKHEKHENDEQGHDKKEQDQENSDKKNIKHLRAESIYHKDHAKKKSKYNTDGNKKRQNEIKERKSEQELVKDDSNEISEERNQRKESPSGENHDDLSDKNDEHHEGKGKLSHEKIEDKKSNMDNQMEHESSNNQRSKAEYNDRNKPTEDRDVFEGNNDDAKHDRKYETHDENLQRRTGKEHREKSSEKDNSGNDEKSKTGQENESGEENESGQEIKTNGVGEARIKEESDGNDRKNDREKSEKAEESKKSNERKSEEIKSKNAHETISDHDDYEDRENKKDLTKKDDDKRRKGSERQKKYRDKTSSHVIHKENYKNKNNGRDNDNFKDDKGTSESKDKNDEGTSDHFDHKEGHKNTNHERDHSGRNRDETSSDDVHQKVSYGENKNTNNDRDDSEHTPGKDENRQENKSRKPEDTDGVRRDHVDHATSSRAKSYSDTKTKKKMNKDEDSSSSELEQFGRKNDHKIGNTHAKTNTNMADKGPHLKNNTNEVKHNNFIHNKFSNHELTNTENGKKNSDHENEKNSDENREKGRLVENEKRKITGKHEEHKQKAIIQKLRTKNDSTKTKETQSQKNYTNTNTTQQSGMHEITDIMDDNNQDTSNTGRPKHKPFLYHSLNEKKLKNNTRAPLKDKIKEALPETNHEHDIMKSNQNYKKPEKLKVEGAEKDKTRFFNQETNEWKESFNGDQVDEGGNFFNQRTRDWSVNQPKTNTDYFHNMTSQWNLENTTKPSDFGKYFNQRTKTWLGNHNTLKKKNNDTTKNVGGNSSMKGTRQQGTSRKLVSATNDNQKKHKQNTAVYKPPQQHKLQLTTPKFHKEKPSQVTHNSTNVRAQLNHSRTSVIPTEVSQSVPKDKSVPHNKVGNGETPEEKIKNEILKLIGEAPDKTTSAHSHRLVNNHLLPSVNVSGSQDTRHTVLRPKNKTRTLLQHKAKPHTMAPKKVLVSEIPHATRTQKVLKTSKFNTKVKSKGIKNNSAPDKKDKTRKKYRVSSTRKQEIGPPLKQPKTKPIRPSKPLAIPIKNHSKFPKLRKKLASMNRVQPTTQPIAKTWKGTLPKPSYSPTIGSIGKYDYQKWNKQNVFDNEWNNVRWNSYYNTYGSNSILPTVKPTVSWGGMVWNTNNGYQNGGIKERGHGITATNYPNVNTPTLAPGNTNKQIPLTVQGGITKGGKLGGMGSTPGVLGPTPAPPRKHGVPLNKNGGLAAKWKVPVLPRPTIAPLYRLGEFPLRGEKTRWSQNVKTPMERQGSSVVGNPLKTITRNSEMTKKKNYFWNENVKIPYQQQGSQAGRDAVDKTTPRRDHVYYFNNDNKQSSFNITQVTKQPRKQTAPRTFVQPLGKTASLTPKTPGQPVTAGKKYLKEVLDRGRMNSSQVQQTSKAIPTPRDVFTRPTIPPHITSKPNQWNKTWPTIRHPFKVNKIQPLQSEKTTKEQQHSNVPKGCFPGEIMSEMTLENGLDAGNYTNLGRTELMDSCISKCCEIKSCEVAVQMDSVCFALKCHSKESCKIKSTLGKSSHHKLCFLSRKKKERQSIFDFDNDILGEQDVCQHEQAVGLNWKTTNAGSFDEIPCPKKAKGLARRKCSIESNWLLPDFSSCVTNEYEDLYQRAKRLVNGEDSSSLLQSLAVVTTRTVDNSLIFGGDLKKTTEIMTSIVQEQGARQDGQIGQKDMENYLITCSNLLDDSNKQEWKNIQKEKRGSADILRDSQTYALIASSKLPEIRDNATYVTNNIVVQMSYEEKGSEAKTFPDYTNTDVALWDGEKDNIRLPDSVFSIGNLKTVTFSYKTLPVLLPMDSNEHFRRSEPNSKILATIVEPRIQDKINPAVTITLHHLKQNRLNPRCVFWDFNLNPAHGGAWSREGCWLESTSKERTICRCDHLANFAVLMDTADYGSMQASAKDERYSKKMAAMWFCIPVLVVLIIAALYVASTWSRGPRRRTLSEKSSLLRSAVTTDEVRYDYSSTPSHNLKGATQARHKEIEWQNEFGKHVEQIKHIEHEKDVERIESGHEMEHDSGIESSVHDSHSELSLSQETLEIRGEQFTDYFEDIPSPEYTHSTTNNASPVHSNTAFTMENAAIYLEVERRIFTTSLRRCCGQEDLSFSKE